MRVCAQPVLCYVDKTVCTCRVRLLLKLPMDSGDKHGVYKLKVLYFSMFYEVAFQFTYLQNNILKLTESTLISECYM